MSLQIFFACLFAKNYREGIKPCSRYKNLRRQNFLLEPTANYETCQWSVFCLPFAKNYREGIKFRL